MKRRFWVHILAVSGSLFLSGSLLALGILIFLFGFWFVFLGTLGMAFLIWFVSMPMMLAGGYGCGSILRNAWKKEDA